MNQADRIVALGDKERVVIIQYRKNKVASDGFAHLCYRFKAQTAVSFQKLHRNVSISFNIRFGKMILDSKLLVVAEDTVMTKGKTAVSRIADKRMIVAVVLCTALCRPAGVSGENGRIRRKEEIDLMGRLRRLINGKISVFDIRASLKTPVQKSRKRVVKR